MLLWGLLFVFVHIGTVSADYFCVCNYDVEKEVFTTMSEQGASLGYMYEFDCKQDVSPDNLASGWIAVAFQHQMGYIQAGQNIQKQTCPGDPPAQDLISTTSQQTETRHFSPQPATVKITPQPATVTTTQTVTTVTLTPSTTTIVASTQIPTTATPRTTTPTPSTTTQQTTDAPVTHVSHTTDGNTHLCPHTIRQHAHQNGGILAQYKGHCYELLPSHVLGWPHGQQVCEENHGNLAHISDADEQDFIQQFLMRHNPDHAVWIGLTDREHEGTYTWTSGVPLQYSNWTPDHEDNFLNHRHEDCVALLPYKNGEWDDFTCGTTGIPGETGRTHPILCQFGTKVAVIG